MHAREESNASGGSRFRLCDRLLLRLLETGVASFGKLGFKLLDPARRIHKLELPCKEGVADVANIDLHLGHCAAGRKRVAAAAANEGVDVLGMDAVFHGRTTFLACERVNG